MNCFRFQRAFVLVRQMKCFFLFSNVNGREKTVMKGCQMNEVCDAGDDYRR